MTWEDAIDVWGCRQHSAHYRYPLRLPGEQRLDIGVLDVLGDVAGSLRTAAGRERGRMGRGWGEVRMGTHGE